MKPKLPGVPVHGFTRITQCRVSWPTKATITTYYEEA